MTPPSFFSPEEELALLAAAPSTWWRAFLSLSLESGLRIQEVLRLHHSDVNTTTQSVRITSDPTDDDFAANVTLRLWLPCCRERVVPVSPRVLTFLSELRLERPDDRHVFVPDWKIDQLWTRLAACAPVTAEALSPRLGECFQMIQRKARLALAASRHVALIDIVWQRRGLAALRTTAVQRLSRQLDLKALSQHLGCSSAAIRVFYGRNTDLKEEVA